MNVCVKKPGPQYTQDSLIPLWYEIVARTRTPTEGTLSVLQYLHVLSKQAVVVWPSIERAHVRLTSAGGDNITWTLECLLRRNDQSKAVDGHTVFILRMGQIKITTSKMHLKVGSHPPNSGNTIRWLSFHLSLRPKFSFIEKTADQPARRRSTDTISFATNKMINRVRSELARRTLTSNVSLLEAAANSLECNFRSSILNEHFELEKVKTIGTYKQGSGPVEWYHERPSQHASLSSTSIGRPALLGEELHPPTSASVTADHEHLTSVCMWSLNSSIR
jgi:hypothetical protein